MRHSTALPIGYVVLRILIVLNWLSGAAILTLLTATIVAEEWTFTALGIPPSSHIRPIIMGLRAIAVLGLVAVPLNDAVLGRLLAIVETVRGGDPFVADNARRLTMIAWALLALQLLDLVYGAIALSVDPGDSPLSGWTFNVTGWIAVLLLFVLARVFEQGSAMRDDIEGTV